MYPISDSGFCRSAPASLTQWKPPRTSFLHFQRIKDDIGKTPLRVLCLTLQLVARLCKATALALASASSASAFPWAAAKSAGVAPLFSVTFRLAPASRTGDCGGAGSRAAQKRHLVEELQCGRLAVIRGIVRCGPSLVEAVTYVGIQIGTSLGRELPCVALSLCPTALWGMSKHSTAARPSRKNHHSPSTARATGPGVPARGPPRRLARQPLSKK